MKDSREEKIEVIIMKKLNSGSEIKDLEKNSP